MAKTKKKTSRVAYWQEHIPKWSESGLIQAEYCRLNKLSPATFQVILSTPIEIMPCILQAESQRKNSQ
ncbi:MAG: hypothetical protein RQ760_09410, partial [Sedimentisphaerales bacterium]|nr:hypothetical protein [Sedimentisphaerales bacterium]